MFLGSDTRPAGGSDYSSLAIISVRRRLAQFKTVCWVTKPVSSPAHVETHRSWSAPVLRKPRRASRSAGTAAPQLPGELTSNEAGAFRNSLARLLDTPHLARVVPHLAPETLHQLIAALRTRCLRGNRRLGDTNAAGVCLRPRSVAERSTRPRRAFRHGALRRMAGTVGGRRRHRRRADGCSHGRSSSDCRTLPVRPCFRHGGDRHDTRW